MRLQNGFWEPDVWPEDLYADSLLDALLLSASSVQQGGENAAGTPSLLSAARGFLRQRDWSQAGHTAEKFLGSDEDMAAAHSIDAKCILVKVHAAQGKVPTCLSLADEVVHEANALGNSMVSAIAKVQLAEVFIAMGRTDRATSLAEEASAAASGAESPGSSSLRGLASLRLARAGLAATQRQGSAEKAYAHAETAAAAFQGERDSLGLSLGYYMQAEARAAQNSLAAAKERLVEALNVAKAAGETWGEALFLLALAKLCMQSGYLVQSLEAAEASLQWLSRSPVALDGFLIEALFVLGTLYARREDVFKASRLAAEWTQRFTRAKHVRGQVAGHLLHMHCHMAQSDEDSAQEASAAACERISGIAGMEKLKVQLHCHVATVHISLDDEDHALKLAEAALHAAEEVGNLWLQASSLEVLLQVHLSMQDSAEVGTLSRKLIDVVGMCKTEMDTALSLIWIAASRSQRDAPASEVEEAMVMATEARQLCRSGNHLYGQAHAAFALAKMKLQLENTRDALEDAQEATRLFQSLGQVESEVRARVLAAEVMLHQYLLDPDADSRDALGFDMKWQCLLDTVAETEIKVRRFGDNEILASFLLLVAHASEAKGLNDDALQAASEAADLFEELEDTHGDAAASLVCSRVYRQEASTSLSKDRAKHALDLYKGCGDAEGVSSALQLLQMA